MRARLLTSLAVGCALAVLACGDDDPDPGATRQLARFDYAARLSIACRRAELRLAEIRPASSRSGLGPMAGRWRAEAERLQRDLIAERFPPHVQSEAEAVIGPADVLEELLGTIEQTARRRRPTQGRVVRGLTGGVRETGDRLRDGGQALGAMACTRVDADAERRLLPAVLRYSRRP
jgi:hypothetical protein